ncbi:MAG: transposase [Verrucomicrobia bacterium]|nr:transposase [Verrucomicrobiota bacterium]
MRLPRIKGEGAAYYHIMSRTIDRAFLLDEEEKERFRRLMRKVAAFSGVEILTYTILDNHWHIHLFAPDPPELSDDEFIERLSYLYDPNFVRSKGSELRHLRETGDDAGADALRARYTYRMHEVSEFMKTLKQRFTQSYNGRHNRSGPLWEDRFKSVLIESGTGLTLAMIAAYIDLNCVRAAIVEDPKDYRYCGYAEALGGDGTARRGIQHIMRIMGQSETWAEAAGTYREWVYKRGEATRESRRPGFAPEKVCQVIATGGKLSFAELGHLRVRYLTDGAVLGSKIYVQDVLEKNRCRISSRRKDGVCSAEGLPVEGLYTLRSTATISYPAMPIAAPSTT